MGFIMTMSDLVECRIFLSESRFYEFRNIYSDRNCCNLQRFPVKVDHSSIPT